MEQLTHMATTKLSNVVKSEFIMSYYDFMLNKLRQKHTGIRTSPAVIANEKNAIDRHVSGIISRLMDAGYADSTLMNNFTSYANRPFSATNESYVDYISKNNDGIIAMASCDSNIGIPEYAEYTKLSSQLNKLKERITVINKQVATSTINDLVNRFGVLFEHDFIKSVN
jgi:hypothetical protein